MGVSFITRRFLPSGSFPQLEGQELPDEAKIVATTQVADTRAKDQGRVIKPPKTAGQDGTPSKPLKEK